MSHNNRDGYGKFGSLVTCYSESRKGFPKEVLDFLENCINGLNTKNVLDLGCGTGISARQLASRGALVVGVDIDPEMIQRAKTDLRNIEFFVSPVKNLPFPNKKFDIATAFSAFHWFCSSDEINEIKRVMNTNGVFFAVNKNDEGDFLDGYRKILLKFTPELPNIKSNYNPEKLLKDHDFEIKKKHFLISEEYSLEKAVFYLQSVSLWNLVPKEKRREALDLVKEYCMKKATNGKITKKVQIIAIAGILHQTGRRSPATLRFQKPKSRHRAQCRLTYAI